MANKVNVPIQLGTLATSGGPVVMQVQDSIGDSILTVNETGEVEFSKQKQSKLILTDENGDEWTLKVEKDSLVIEPKNVRKRREFKLSDVIDGDK